MGYLKYYMNENIDYKEHYNKAYTQEEADKIIKKLIRRFMIKGIKNIYYTEEEGRGKAATGWIKLPKENISLGVICHEIGHHYAFEKTGQSNHIDKTYIKMRQIYRYTERYLSPLARLK